MWAILPVKPLKNTKTRLAPVLSPLERELLTRRTLSQLLNALAGVPAISRTIVVSREPTMPALIGRFGADLYVEKTTSGLSAAMMEVMRWLGRRSERLLILPSDLPLVTAADIGQMAGLPTPGGICSDRHGTGTNALLLPAGTPFTFYFGPHSFPRHCREFERADIPYQIVAAPGLQFDLDTPEDWQALQAMNKTA